MKNIMPEISIIVPIYNSEKSIGRLIESILAQSFNNFELILVDDFSSDGSRDICNLYAEKDSRIRLIYLEENRGVSNARNMGLNAAIGRYIMFADSDDCVDKNWCQELYDIKQKYPMALITSNIYNVDDLGNVIPKVSNSFSSGILSSYFDLFQLGISGYTVNKIFELEILNKYSIRFVQGQYTGEDVVFIINYIKYCSSYVYIDKPLYYYYANPQSVLHTYHEDDLLQNLHLFAARLHIIEQKDLTEYCDIYFSYLVGLFQNILDPRCKRSFLQKMRYNQYVMHSREFKFCVEHMSGKNESAFFLRVIRTYNYYLLWAFQKFSFLVKSFIKK